MDPRNPAVKRLKKELDEIEADEHKHYSVHPLEVKCPFLKRRIISLNGISLLKVPMIQFTKEVSIMAS